MNSRLWERKIKKHKIEKIGCDGEQKADENWISAETSKVCDVARRQKICWTMSVQGFEGQRGKLKP